MPERLHGGIARDANRVYEPEKSTFQSLTGTVKNDAPSVGANEGFRFFHNLKCVRNHTQMHTYIHTNDVGGDYPRTVVTELRR